MSRQLWFEPFVSAAGDGTALTNSTTATSLLPAANKFTLPSAFFQYADGTTLRFRATGRISTVVTTPGTLTLDIRFGSVVVFNGGAMTLNTTAQTNVNWVFEADLVIRAVGASTSANVIGQGFFMSHAVIGSPAPTAGGCGTHLLPYNAAPAVGTGFDSTASQTIDFFGTWSVANASNSITLHTASIASIN